MKGDAWDGGHHIPLIIKWSGKIKEGQVYDKTVGLNDFYSTLADLTGTKLSDKTAEDSFSFLKVLNGDLENPVRDHLIYLSSSGRLAIKKGDWKYVEGLGSGGFSVPSKLPPVKNGPTGQLYNMKDDPLESNNLFLHKPDIVNDLTSLMEELVDRGYSRNVR
jgi:arylsulfatase A